MKKAALLSKIRRPRFCMPRIGDGGVCVTGINFKLGFLDRYCITSFAIKRIIILEVGEIF